MTKLTMHKSSPSKIWRKFNSRYSLVGSKSKVTDKTYYPPVHVEPENGNQEFSTHNFKKQAKLVSWSRVSAAPEGYGEFVPYVMAILELENGEKLTTQVVDVDYNKLQKGDILVTTFRKYYEDGDDGVIHYGLKWTKK